MCVRVHTQGMRQLAIGLTDSVGRRDTGTRGQREHSPGAPQAGPEVCKRAGREDTGLETGAMHKQSGRSSHDSDERDKAGGKQDTAGIT